MCAMKQTPSPKVAYTSTYAWSENHAALIPFTLVLAGAPYLFLTQSQYNYLMLSVTLYLRLLHCLLKAFFDSIWSFQALVVFYVACIHDNPDPILRYYRFLLLVGTMPPPASTTPCSQPGGVATASGTSKSVSQKQQRGQAGGSSGSYISRNSCKARPSSFATMVEDRQHPWT